jgi:phenylacetic acid degradation protein
MKVYSFQGITPVVDRTAYVHDTASLIGDVIIGPGVYVAPFVSLRGDFGRLIIEQGANIQDHCVMHGFPDRDTVVEAHGHIGHHAIVHGAIVRRNALVGMGAVLLDYCEIGSEAIIAALALVKAGEVVPPRTMWAGIPARKMRDVGEGDIEWKNAATRDYQRLVEISRETLRPAEALRAAEPNRRRPTACAAPAKIATRR